MVMIGYWLTLEEEIKTLAFTCDLWNFNIDTLSIIVSLMAMIYWSIPFPRYHLSVYYGGVNLANLEWNIMRDIRWHYCLKESQPWIQEITDVWYMSMKYYAILCIYLSYVRFSSSKPFRIKLPKLSFSDAT